MDNIDSIIERLKENEETVKKFYKVETKILGILDFKDFFEILLTKIKKIFKVPYVWISLIKTSEVANLIHHLESSIILRKNINIIDRNSFLQLVGNETTPLLANNNLKPFYKLATIRRKYLIGSIAIAPISIDGEIIGSLNQADPSHLRFQPGIDTTLLEHLAVKVSLCLSNVTAHEKLKIIAYHDPLTGLLNRRTMNKVLKREFARSNKYNRPLSVIFIDIDNLERTNDMYGHDVGDLLIKYVAEMLFDKCREPDIVSRLGEDKFVVILPEMEKNNAKKVLNRIKLYCLEHPLNVEKTSIPVSISFGIAAADKEIKSGDMLLRQAKTNLYNSKKTKHKKSGEKNNMVHLFKKKPY